MMNSYDIVADAVRDYWSNVKGYPCDVIAFFYQKYAHESDKEWCWMQELCFPHSSGDYNTVEFLSDFCEGETDVKDLKIAALDDILDYYVENHKEV